MKLLAYCSTLYAGYCSLRCFEKADSVVLKQIPVHRMSGLISLSKNEITGYCEWVNYRMNTFMKINKSNTFMVNLL